MNALRIVVLAALVTVVVGACFGGAAAGVTPPPDADATVTASSGSFSPSQLDIPSGEPITLFFRNLDATEHNVSIYTDSSAAMSVFAGQVVNDAAITYHVPALVAGDYFFRCDVHPNMTGAIVAG